MRWLELFASFSVSRAGSAPHASIMEELLQLRDFDERQRHATLVSLVSMAKIRRQLEEAGVNHTKPAFNCPEPGAGVPVNSEHILEDFHYKKFRMWAEDYDFCSSSLGLWTGGCGAVCGLRAAVVGHMVQLRPGQLVLDVGSGCGHFAEWFYDWFGAQTIGVDFQRAGVDYANHHVATSVPAQFCWMDVASQLSSHWLPAHSVDLAIAISLHAMELAEVELPGPGDEAAPRHAVAGGHCTDWDIWFQVLASQYPSWKDEKQDACTVVLQELSAARFTTEDYMVSFGRCLLDRDAVVTLWVVSAKLSFIKLSKQCLRSICLSCRNELMNYATCAPQLLIDSAPASHSDDRPGCEPLRVGISRKASIRSLSSLCYTQVQHGLTLPSHGLRKHGFGFG
eukprot:s1691_g7.t1